MHISDVYLGLGQDAFGQLISGISIGKLKTYQIYEGFKVRAHLQKVNTESLRKAIPKLWERIVGRDEDFAKDLAQAVLVSHLDMITAVLDFLTIPHENGFFAKEMDHKPYFTEGWEWRVYENFRGTWPEALLLFYVNHLRWELLGAEEVYRPASRSEEHTSELQSLRHLVCRLLLEKKKKKTNNKTQKTKKKNTITNTK